MPTKASRIKELINKNLSFAPNSLWASKDYANLLDRAASYNSYPETVGKESLPDADSLHRNLEGTGLGELREACWSLVKKDLERFGDEPLILIFDCTREPFYGEPDSPWIHPYCPVDGTSGSFKFFVASCLIDGKRRFLDAKLLNQFSEPIKEVEGVLERLEDFEIEVVLFDRGLTSSDLLELLDSKDLDYLGLCQKYANVKRIIEGMDGDFLHREFELKDVETNLVVVKDEDWNWTFLSSMGLAEGAEYVRLYRKRWNIETGFRVHDEARVKSKSRRPEVRYFLFLVGLLLYNCWKILELDLPFKRFLIKLNEHGGELSEDWKPG